MADAPVATIRIHTDDVIGDVAPTIFGGFAEHMGRCIYGGIYDPESPHADERGLRADVLAALREQRYTVMRYPGGNFVSGYQWRDGVGPRDQRPRRRELAWRQIETNEFGTDEFIAFCRTLDVEPMLAVNLGTGSIADAGDLVEYCNAPLGTELADLRARHGNPKPHGVKYWCLGNEMDGPWQIGGLDAIDYAKKAREAAKIMKWQDPTIQTIACGSSVPFMKTYPAWDRTALETCWPHIDWLALHNYATNWEDDTTSFLGYGVEFESHIDTLATILRETKQKLGAKNDVYLSQDEWNVWYKDRSMDGKWAVGPALCEETYNLEDVLVLAQWLNVFLRKCDVLRMACLAQVVNTIAPLKTTRDSLLRESTYYAFLMYSRHARGRSLRPAVEAGRIATKRFGDVSTIDAAATIDEAARTAQVYLVHRGQTESLRAQVAFEGAAVPARVVEIEQIAGLDPKAANTFERPDVVLPRTLGTATTTTLSGGHFDLKLPPLSLTRIQLHI